MSKKEEVFFDSYDGRVRVTSKQVIVDGTYFPISNISSAELNLMPVNRNIGLVLYLLSSGLFIFSYVLLLQEQCAGCMLISGTMFLVALATYFYRGGNTYQVRLFDRQRRLLKFPLVDRNYAQSAVDAINIAVEEYEYSKGVSSVGQFSYQPVPPLQAPPPSISGPGVTFKREDQSKSPGYPESRVEFTKPIGGPPSHGSSSGRVEFTKPLPAQNIPSNFTAPLPESLQSEFSGAPSNFTAPLPENPQSGFSGAPSNFTAPLPENPQSEFTHPLPSQSQPSNFTAPLPEPVSEYDKKGPDKRFTIKKAKKSKSKSDMRFEANQERREFDSSSKIFDKDTESDFM